MAWNTQNSILGTGNTRADVIRESDVIFTALFIGATHSQNERTGSAWRVDMEPNIDEAKLEDRTADDRKSMETLNNACSKVNAILGNWKDSEEPGLQWGLTPLFDRGGMILAGGKAAKEYDLAKKEYLKAAYLYLTASHRAARDGRRQDEMYIGRGAYCGIVVDTDGNAVTAMSTIRTTLNEQTAHIGDRWRPPAGADIRAGQYGTEAKTAAWGIIGSNKIQDLCREQGMRFFPQPGGKPLPLDEEKDIVGYTHGMIRSIYETRRMGQGYAFEMSVGTATYKLASCMSCSSFMMANGLDASSTHLGRGESWVPYYSGESHNPSPIDYPDQIPLDDAIASCNKEHALFMHNALSNGVDAMLKSEAWIGETHLPALKKLDLHLKSNASVDNTVARDLYLDAMTVHKSDLARLDHTLVIPPGDTERCKQLDWYAGPPSYQRTWRKWENIFTDVEIKLFHTPPDSLIEITYRLTAYADNADDACDLDYALTDENGKMKSEGKLVPGDSKGTFEIKLNGSVDFETWKIRVGTDTRFSSIKLDENTAIGSGRYRYVISALTR